MRYLIAMDSGGTKTESILFDETGHILHRRISLGCNPLDVGLECTRERAMDALRTIAALSPEPVAAAYLAIAGVYYYHGKVFPKSWYDAAGISRIRIEEDGRSMVSSELCHEEDGCGVICGTGCSAWVRKKPQRTLVHLGGWGYLLDTLGSGYILGRDAVHAVCLAIDGRGEPTVLQELIETDLGTDLVSGTPELYAGGRRRIAALAYTVFEGARRGDAISQRILDTGAGHMAGLIWAADRYFEEPYPVVVGGGIVTAFPEYYRAIQEKAPERAHLLPAQMPPVFGGAVEAMRDCGLSIDGAFRDRFKADYQRLKGAEAGAQ